MSIYCKFLVINEQERRGSYFENLYYKLNVEMIKTDLNEYYIKGMGAHEFISYTDIT